MPRTVLILLAAGNSSRLGRSKQMLPLSGDESLLQHTIGAGLESEVDEVILVLGSEFETHHEHVKAFHERLHILKNDNWPDGMGSSIKLGLAYAKSHLQTWSNLILTVCDQPFVQSDVFNELVYSSLKSKKTCFASRYDEQNFGVPVLFKKPWCDVLQKIPDDSGALFLLKQHMDEMETVDFVQGAIDIDTVQDWENLQEMHINA